MLLYYSRTLWSRRSERWCACLVMVLLVARTLTAGAQSSAADSAVLPVYDIDASLDPTRGMLRGTARVEWVNRSATPVRELCLSLPSAALTITALRLVRPRTLDLLAGARLDRSDSPSDTRWLMPAQDTSLAAGETAAIEVAWTVRLAPWPENIMPKAIVATEWVPSLAATCDARAREVSSYAHYRARIAVPADWRIAAGDRDVELPADSDGAQRLTVEYPAAIDPAWLALSGFEERRETLDPGRGDPVDLRFFLKPTRSAQADRIVQTTKSAWRRLCDWHGPSHIRQITVVDAPWNSGLDGVVFSGMVIVASRWLQPQRDLSLERRLIAALARQPWGALAPRTPADGWFVAGLARHTAVRAINATLEGRHYFSNRAFGGFVPVTVRALELSRSAGDPRPLVSRFDELDTPTPGRGGETPTGRSGRQAALALLSLERAIGWPALQQALEALAGRFALKWPGPADLAAILSEQRGVEAPWIVGEGAPTSTGTDYTVHALTSEPSGQGHGFRTIVRVKRVGDVPPATGVGRASGETSPVVPVAIRFADGREIEERWDGRQADLALEFESAAPAVQASVDPQAVLLIDADRRNNTRSLHPHLPRAGLRRLGNWLVWLQDLVLTATALV